MARTKRGKIYDFFQSYTKKTWTDKGRLFAEFSNLAFDAIKKSGDEQTISVYFNDLSEYKIGDLLGEGTYGQVFKATGKEGKVYAIKFSKTPYVVGLPTEINELIQEVYGLWKNELGLGEIVALKKIRTLKNRGLLPVMVDYGVTTRDNDPVSFIVMEYIEGKTLTKFMDCSYESGWYMSQEQFNRLSSLLFGAVSIFHSLGFVHLDINPNNIMFTGESIKLIDFGFSCSAEKIEGCEYFDSTLRPPEMYGKKDCSERKCTIEELYKIDVWTTALTLLIILVSPLFGSEFRPDTASPAEYVKFIGERVKAAKARGYKFPQSFLDSLSVQPEKRPSSEKIFLDFKKF